MYLTLSEIGLLFWPFSQGFLADFGFYFQPHISMYNIAGDAVALALSLGQMDL